MRALAGSAMLLLFTAITVFAQESAPVAYTGYVVDQMCAKKMSTKTDVMKRAAGHTKDCALEDACSASGYGIFSSSLRRSRTWASVSGSLIFFMA